MPNGDTILVFIDFWGLISSKQHISVLFHSPSNPEIVKTMSNDLEELCHKYNLEYERKEEYVGDVYYKVTGELTSWKNFGCFFRQRIMEVLANARTNFEISTSCIHYAESHGIFDSGVVTQEYLEKLLQPTEPNIDPPK
jgi:hypothetical protein